MTFPSAALTGAQYAKLRGGGGIIPRWSGAQYLSLVPNTTIYSARVNGAPTSTPFAEVTYDTGSGTLADVQVGMTVLIAATNDRRAAYFAGRVRSAPTATILYINESSVDIADNDYIFVIDDYRLWPKLARTTGGVDYKDWDKTFAQLPPVVAGLQTFYGGFVNASNVLRMAFDISSSYAATVSATLSTYAWTFPAGTTVISGSLSAAAVTVDVPVGVPAWGKVVLTDSGSRSTTRHFVIHAAARVGANAPALGFTGARLSYDLANGPSGSIGAFDGISTVLDNTFVGIWREEYYNDVEGSLFAGTNTPNNVDFVGRLRIERDISKPDDLATLVNETEFELEGPGIQMARLHGGLITVIDSASPATWSDINTLTPWRAVVHFLAEHSTFLSLHDLTFDSTAATFRCKAVTTQGSNLLGVVNDIGESINAALEFSPAGAARMVRDPNVLSVAERNALTTLANLTELDYIDLSLIIEHADKMGGLQMYGGCYDSTSGNVTPFMSIAPGHAQDYAEGSSTLSRQILQANVAAATAQTELNTRAGHVLAEANASTELTVVHPDGYHPFIPSRRYWFTWTLGSTNNIRGLAYTTAERWLLTALSFEHDNAAGLRNVNATYRLETAGDAGESVTYPAAAELPLDPGLFIPGFDPYPGLPFEPIVNGISDIIGEDPFRPDTLKRDGSIVLSWSASAVYLTLDFLASNNPVWRDITPDDIITNGYTVVAAAWYLGFDGTAYVLAYTGTHSIVYRTDNAFANPPVWTTGAAVSGQYTVLRTTSTVDNIFIYAPIVTNAPVTIFITFDSGEFPTYTIEHGTLSASGNPGNSLWGGTSTNNSCLDDDGFARILIDLGAPQTVTGLAFDGRNTTSDYRWGWAVYYFDSGMIQIASDGAGVVLGAGWHTVDNQAINVPNCRYVRVDIAHCTGGAGQNAYMDNVELTYLVTSALAAYSASGGAAWINYPDFGSTPGASGGFDAVWIGSSSIGAGDAQTYKATALGGAYSSTGSDGATAGTDPNLVLIPWYRWGLDNTKNTSTSTPDYLLGSLAVVGSDCLWRVAGAGGRTAITPTGATAMVGPNCATTWKGTRAAVIASVSGTRHLFTSTSIGSTDTWTDRGAVNAASNYVRVRRKTGTGAQLFWNSGTGIGYKSTFSATALTKTTPSTTTILGVEAFG